MGTTPHAQSARREGRRSCRLPIRASTQGTHRGSARFFTNAIKLLLCRIHRPAEEKPVHISVRHGRAAENSRGRHEEILEDLIENGIAA